MAAPTKPPTQSGAARSGNSALFLLDPHGGITGWTGAAEAASGYPPDELHGMALDRLVTTEAAAGDIDAALSKARRDGRFSGEGWLTPKAGERIQASLEIQSLRAGTDVIAGFAVTVGHLATRRPDETELADGEQKFRMLVQGVTDYAIYMIDPRGYITNWNLGGERIKGYRAEEVIGGHFSQFYMPEDRAAGIPARALEIAAREGRYEGEGWRIRKDGTRFWAGVIIDRILDPDGKLVGFAKITRDMTEKRRAEEALEQARAALAQAQKMEAVGQLTGGVAHDFNNLLTVITNSLDLLETRLRPDPQTRRIIDSAQRAAERGARLTEQLLAFSRRQPLRPEINNINALIEGFEAVLRRACPEPIELEMALDPRPLAANIDSAQFETALLNLIVNARDAMPKGGSVRISTGRRKLGAAEAKAMSELPPGDYVTVGVADTGEGMAPEVVSRVFEPFFTTKEVGKGSGLGLSQVYGFVTQSGGHVAIDSKPGAGTTVTLYLPAAPAVAAGRSASDPHATTTPPVGRILIVEDDPEVLDVTVEMLRTLGWEVLTAPDAPSGLSVLRRDADIDVLFSDIVMPRGMNGVELAREARRLRPELRVLLASGYPASALPAGNGAGEEDEFPFLSKPYRASELARKLRAMQPRVRTR
ncbi:MAG: hybrid sensor histidine kinase/response regulator [Alphaproteobacteria bacterium 13_1_20CM_3_64_12]|nr:MAG: hybrid sensor histidine kinase/response regulator [Alphaproteobacteria bacterium 13_1_20CM_3_64_12]